MIVLSDANGRVKLFDYIFTNSRDPIIIFNGTMVVDANQSALDIFEIEKKEDFIDHDISEFIENPEIAKERAEKRRQGISELINTTIKTPSGTKELEVMANAVFIPGITSYTIIRDITERTQFVKELSQKDARWETLFNSLDQGVAIYRPTSDGEDFVFVDINEKGQEIDKINKKEVIGKKVTKIFPGINDFGLLDVLKEVNKTSIPKQHPINQYRDNRITGWRENYVFKLESGELVAVYTDITHIKLLEDRYKRIFEESNDAILITDETSTVFINPKGLVLLELTDPSEIIGKSLTEFIHPDYRSMATDYAKARREGKTPPSQYDVQILTKYGNVIDVELSASRIIWNNNPASVTIVRDITERKSNENKIELFNRQIATLYRHSTDMLQAESIDDIFEQTFKAMNEALEGVVYNITVVEGDQLVDRYYTVLPLTIPLNSPQSIVAKVAREKKSILINDTSKISEYLSVSQINLLSEIAVPIIVGGEVVAVINVESEKRNAFQQYDLEILETLALNVGNSISRLNQIEELEFRNRVNASVIKSMYQILDQTSFEDTARIIFDNLRELTGAKSGYVALLSEDGEENEVLFLEAGGLPCMVDPYLPMPIRGLRAESYLTGKTVFENKFMETKWIEFMPEGHVYLKNVMFAPLVIENKTVGIIGLANKPTDFIQRDVDVGAQFGAIAALALSSAKKNQDLVIKDEELSVSNIKYQELFNNLIGGYAYHKIIYDEHNVPVDYSYVEVNTAFSQIMGIPISELVGKRVTEVLPDIEDDPADWIGTYGHIADTQGNMSFEQYSIPLEKWFYINAYSDRKGYFATIANDITTTKESERKRQALERELFEERIELEHSKELGELKTSFMNTAAHEIRTPITVIQGYSEILKEKHATNTPEETDMTLQILLRNVKRLEHLSNDLLDQQRIESNQLKLQREEIDPIECIRQVIEDIEPILEVKNQVIINDIQLKNIMCYGDKTRLAQVLLNLLNNASEYSDDHTQIILNGHVNQGKITISVTDQGIGLTKEDISKLFKPFPDLSKSRHGTGLGLSICKGIIELHGGEIEAKSEGRGKGSTFKFTIPT